jgi:UDP-N-acetylmuramoyl-tripeptide--D-alanyl-D-alanine ligase
MPELGAVGADLHHGLIAAVKTDCIGAVFRGPMMCNLSDALSSGDRGGYAQRADGLESQMRLAIPWRSGSAASSWSRARSARA